MGSPRFLTFLKYKIRRNLQNSKTYSWLGQFYYIRMSDNEGEARRIAGIKALEYYEYWLGLANASRVYGEYSPVRYMAHIAFEIDEFKKAKKFASILFAYKNSYPERFPYNIPRQYGSWQSIIVGWKYPFIENISPEGR